MEFTYISLTRAELRLLRRARRRVVPADNAERLLRLGLLADISAPPAPGYAPVSSGLAELTPRGLDYSLYHAESVRKAVFTPVVVSLLTNAAIRCIEWLWPQISRLLSTALSALFA